MKHIFIGLVFIFIACTTYAEDIEPQQRPVLATAAYVQSAYETVTNQLSGKQDKLIAGDGITITSDGTISADVAVAEYEIGTADTPGVMKLYTDIGTATDGTMTQKAITDELNKKIENTATGENALAVGFYEEDTAKQNTATGYEAIAIGMGNSAGNDFNITIGTGNIANNDAYNAVIGSNNTAGSASGVIVGADNTVGGFNAIAIGMGNTVDYDLGIAVGTFANVHAAGAIQLGYGENYEKNTLNVGFVDPYTMEGHNYPLLASGGVIPAGRLTGQTNGADNNGHFGQVLTSTGNGGMRWAYVDVPDLPTGPDDGMYKLVWNGKIKKFIFQKESDGLTCSSGEFDIGFTQCVGLEIQGNDRGYYSHNGVKTYQTNTYSLEPGTWAVEFDYGIVKGKASCNNTRGTYYQATTTEFSQEDEGQYCWCKMTSPAASRWVFFSNGDNALGCASDCASDCASSILINSLFRSGMFSSVGQ